MEMKIMTTRKFLAWRDTISLYCRGRMVFCG